MLYDQTTFVYNYTLSVAADVFPETNDKTHTQTLNAANVPACGPRSDEKHLILSLY
jgi:hypothetical protein